MAREERMSDGATTRERLKCWEEVVLIAGPRMAMASALRFRLVLGIILFVIGIYVLLGPPSPAPLFELATVSTGPVGITGISEQSAIRLFIGFGLLVASFWFIVGRTPGSL